MQLLHHTWRSRIERLNVAGVIGGSPGTYGAQQRFSALTSSPMSSERQKERDRLPELKKVEEEFLYSHPQAAPGDSYQQELKRKAGGDE
jgi:hypothetical protein